MKSNFSLYESTLLHKGHFAKWNAHQQGKYGEGTNTMQPNTLDKCMFGEDTSRGFISIVHVLYRMGKPMTIMCSKLLDEHVGTPNKMVRDTPIL